MELSIIGFSNSGKTTLFNALTGASIPVTPVATLDAKPVEKFVSVPDARIDFLSDLFKPQKTTYSTIRYIDFIGLSRGDNKKNRQVMDLIKDSNAIVNVVRAFKSDSVIHPLETVDYMRDILLFESEMILLDLELVENRISRIEEGEKKGKKANLQEKELLKKCLDYLSNNKPLREVEFSPSEILELRHLQFASIKPLLIVVNVDENTQKEQMLEIEKRIENDFIKNRQMLNVITLCAKIESEIASLDSEERELFLKELNIEKPALNKVIESSYKMLNLISFLTVGEDEVRAWPIKSGTNAQQAAGKIHSDLEKGFIKAEVVSYRDFTEMIKEQGGKLPADYMQTLKSTGRLRLEPRDYIVKDGDIINFRHAT